MSFDPNERLAEWVDGTMGDRELARFEAELDANADLRERALEYRRSVEAVRAALTEPLAGDEADPGLSSAALTDRIMGAVQAGRPPTALGRWSGGGWRSGRWGPVFLSMAAAASILGGAFLIQQLGSSPDATRERAEARGDEARDAKPGRQGERAAAAPEVAAPKAGDLVEQLNARLNRKVAADEDADAAEPAKFLRLDERTGQSGGGAGSEPGVSSIAPQGATPAADPGAPSTDRSKAAMAFPDLEQRNPEQRNPEQGGPEQQDLAQRRRENPARARGHADRVLPSARKGDDPGSAEPLSDKIDPPTIASPNSETSRATLSAGEAGPTARPEPDAAPGAVPSDDFWMGQGIRRGAGPDEQAERGPAAAEDRSPLVVVTLPPPQAGQPDALAREVLRSGIAFSASVAPRVAPLNLEFVAGRLGLPAAESTLVTTAPLHGYLLDNGLVEEGELSTVRAFRANGSPLAMRGLVGGLSGWATDNRARVDLAQVPTDQLASLEGIESANAMLRYLASGQAPGEIDAERPAPVEATPEPAAGPGEARPAGDPAAPVTGGGANTDRAADRDREDSSENMSVLVVFRTAQVPAAPAPPERIPEGPGENANRPRTDPPSPSATPSEPKDPKPQGNATGSTPGGSGSGAATGGGGRSGGNGR